MDLHIMRFTVKEWRSVRDNIKDKDTSYSAQNSLIQGYEISRIDKGNEDWFFNVILSSIMRVDKISVDWQGLTWKIMIGHKKHKDWWQEKVD